jgi:hypothetical protein
VDVRHQQNSKQRRGEGVVREKRQATRKHERRNCSGPRRVRQPLVV